MNTNSRKPTETDTQALYECFPHLRQIDLMWGSRECRRFVFQLMTDTRGGARRGFPPEHAMTVMSLLLEHDRNFPEFEHDGHAAWDNDSTRRGGGLF